MGQAAIPGCQYGGIKIKTQRRRQYLRNRKRESGSSHFVSGIEAEHHQNYLAARERHRADDRQRQKPKQAAEIAIEVLPMPGASAVARSWRKSKEKMEKQDGYRPERTRLRDVVIGQPRNKNMARMAPENEREPSDKQLSNTFKNTNSQTSVNCLPVRPRSRNTVY